MERAFKTMFRKFCLDSTIVGLKFFYLYPDIISRCFWLVHLTFILTFACLLAWRLYLRFDEMPTRITIENQHQDVVGLPFPAIAICTPNQFTFSAMQHFNRTLVDGNRTWSLDDALVLLTGFYEPNNFAYDEDALNNLQQLIDINRYTVPEVMVSLPQSCDRFLRLCIFQGRVYSCMELFRPILTQHGLCCIFNSPYYFKNNRRNEYDSEFRYRKIMRADISQGLTVVSDFEPQDALDGTLFYSGSVRVMVMDWNEFPANDNSHLLQPQTECFHSLRATYTYCSPDVTSLPPSSRQCYFEKEQRLDYFRLYHNSDCDLLCLVRAVERICHCLMFYVPNLRITRTCNVTSINCINQVKEKMTALSETEPCDCPRDCNSRRYTAELNVGNFDGLPYMFSNPYKNLVMNKSTSLMHFFFPTPVYVKQKQETVMSITTLAANLGGVFGLCLGCSVISVLEIVFYAYLTLRNAIRARLRVNWRQRCGVIFIN